MKQIPLFGKYGIGKFALVDDEDYDRVSKLKWYVSKGGYVFYSAGRNKTKKINGRVWIKMHRFVMNADDGDIIDHADRNKLNNCKVNLRKVSSLENAHNSTKRTGTKNKFKGVNYIKRVRLYCAVCRINRQYSFLGYFKTELAAACAYNKTARTLSSKALLNDVGMDETTADAYCEQNRKIPKKAEFKSKHKGVTWSKKRSGGRGGVWCVYVHVNRKRVYVGEFKKEKDAVIALKKARIKYNLK